MWTVVSLVIISTYFYNYHRPEGHPPLLFFIRHPVEYIKYVLVYLGTPVCRFRTYGAIFFGLLGLIISGYIIRALIKSGQIKFTSLVPYVALSLYALGSAMITAIGRLGFTYVHAMSSRYVTSANLLWISNIALFYLLAKVRRIELKNKIINAASTKSGTDELCRICSEHTSLQVKRLSVIVIVILFVILNSAVAVLEIKSYHAKLASAHAELLGPAQDDELLRRIYPEADEVRTRKAILQKYKLSLFRD